MLGPMGAFIMSILRVMTPAEIDRYAKTSSDGGVRAIAAGGEEFDLMDSDSFVDEDQAKAEHKKAAPQGEAKIIPIRPNVESEDHDQPPDPHKDD
ncbi:MAG: hypothetical protein KC478_12565, partial [Bacteriovoracaceae bacterium]|nr:hypothetical protein [Bacteriovoracaceae bacterium]